MKVDVPMLIAA